MDENNNSLLIKVDDSVIDMKISEYFDNVYKYQKWIDNKYKDQPLSGNGSSIYNTTILINDLKKLIIKYNIKSIVDCGCGSFNYLVPLLDFFESNIESYLGIDIVSSVINQNNNNYSNNKINFLNDDICNTDKINNYDLIICKEVLMHLSTDLIIKFLKNVKKYNCKYILVSSFRNEKPLPYYAGFVEYGALHKNNLFNPPYNFGGPLEVISQNDDTDEHKLYLWKVDDIPEL